METKWLTDTWIIKFAELVELGQFQNTPTGLSKFIESYAIKLPKRNTDQIWLSIPDILQYALTVKNEIFTCNLEGLKMFINVNKSKLYSQAKKK